MTLAEEFDQHASEYTDSINESIEFSGCDHAFFTALKASEIAGLLRDVSSLDPCQVLDLGCGIGAIHPHLSAAGQFDLVGIDVSQASIDLAQSLNPKSTFLRYDGRRVPFDDESFDAAFAICVLHHVAPEARVAFSAEMYRIVRPGGLGIIIEHNPINPVTRHVVNSCAMDKDAILLSSRECAGLLQAAGFMAIETNFIALLPVISGWARRIERLFRRIPLGAQYITHGLRP